MGDLPGRPAAERFGCRAAGGAPTRARTWVGGRNSPAGMRPARPRVPTVVAMTDPTVATTDLSTPAARRRARLRQLNARMWFDLFTVLTAAVLFPVAWPTLHLTHEVPAAVQPFLAALAAFPVLLVRLNPPLGWAISAGSALLIALAIPHTPGNDIPFQV